jgi:hypothetical protein
MSNKMKADLIDLIRYVILKAPDRFPSDTGMTLEKAFDEMNFVLDAMGNNIVQKEMLAAAFECYKTRNTKQAIINLQQLEGALTDRPTQH